MLGPSEDKPVAYMSVGPLAGNQTVNIELWRRLVAWLKLLLPALLP